MTDWNTLEFNLQHLTYECEIPGHWASVGVPGENHDNTGDLWLMILNRPCCPMEIHYILCETAHNLLVKKMSEGETFECVTCHGEFTFDEYYTKSVKWG